MSVGFDAIAQLALRAEAVGLLTDALTASGGLPPVEPGEFWLFDVERARCGGWDFALRRCPSSLLTHNMRSGEARLRAEAQRLGEASGQVVFLLVTEADGRALSDVVWVAPGNGPSP